MNACLPCVTCIFVDGRVSGAALSQNREQALRTRSPLPNEQALRTRGAMANRQAQLTRGPMPIWDHSTPDHASLEHQNRVRYLTDSEGEQPNCLWKSRRLSQLILTCGFAARNWGSTRAKPDWLLTFAIPLFMRLRSSAKREPGRRNAYRARGSNAICGPRGYFLLRLTVTPAAMQTTAATANTMGSVALLVSPVWGSCFAGCSGSLGLAAGAV